MYFQYQTTFTGPDTTGDIYFGFKDGYWYLAEIQVYNDFELGGENGSTEIPTMAVLAKVKDDSSIAEIYQLAIEKWDGDDHAVILQIIADRKNEIFEIATASTYDGVIPMGTASMYTGIGCGVRMKTDGINIYASGRFSNGPDCGESAEYRVRAGDFTDGAGVCDSINTFNVLNLTKTGLADSNAGGVLRDIIINKAGMPSELQNI